MLCDGGHVSHPLWAFVSSVVKLKTVPSLLALALCELAWQRVTGSGVFQQGPQLMTAPAPPLESGTRTTSCRPSPFLLSSLDVQVPVVGVRRDPGTGEQRRTGGWMNGGALFFLYKKEFEEGEKMNEGGMERDSKRLP